MVSKQFLLRGFDYKCPTGVALLVAKQFDSERSLKQGMNRVGRYDSDVYFKGYHPGLGLNNLVDRE